MRFAFAGDRLISCEILEFILSKGFKPLALFVSSETKNSHANKLISISNLSEDRIFWGSDFKRNENIKLLQKLNLDYIIGIHFPYIIPLNVLSIPKVGFINLHPAYLPFNKGWHTPTWAILEGTIYGATLHFMAEELDAGDIIHQKKIEISVTDTANTLYNKVLKLEKETFVEAFDDLLLLNPKRFKQLSSGTSHQKKQLESIREIKLNQKVNTQDFLNKLRALTTNSWNESAFFLHEGKKYGVQVLIKELENE